MDDTRKAFRILVTEPRDHLEESGVNGRKILQGFRINKMCSMYCNEVDQIQTSRRHFCLHGNELLGIIGAGICLDERLPIFLRKVRSVFTYSYFVKKLQTRRKL